MHRLIIFFLLLPVLLFAQQKQQTYNALSPAHNIHFLKILNWDELLETAKKENKYIFVDCMATWCAPCRQMDLVYQLRNVAKFTNENFLSIKLQIDSTKNDDEFIKQWYAQTKIFIKKYRISSLPTYLFFSPQGVLVHEDQGLKSENEFLQILKTALNSSDQIFTKYSRFTNGKLEVEAYPLLIKNLKLYGYKEKADTVANVYLTHLFTMPIDSILNQESLSLVSLYLKASNNKIFKFISNNKAKTDSIVKSKGFSDHIINKVIVNEEIVPNIVGLKNEPSWDKMSHQIKVKYGDEFVERNIISAKIKWYSENKDWEKLGHAYIEQIDKLGMDTTKIGLLLLNNIIWDVIFKHCRDQSTLETGILWMKTVLSSDPQNPNNIDTYANLLYKAGYKQAAIKWEKKAAAIQIKNNPRQRKVDNVFLITIDKMRRDLPTWN